MTLPINDLYVGNVMRLPLAMLNNRRRLRVVTAAATLTACVGYSSAAVGHDSELGGTR